MLFRVDERPRAAAQDRRRHGKTDRVLRSLLSQPSALVIRGRCQPRWNCCRADMTTPALAPILGSSFIWISSLNDVIISFRHRPSASRWSMSPFWWLFGEKKQPEPQPQPQARKTTPARNYVEELRLSWAAPHLTISVVDVRPGVRDERVTTLRDGEERRTAATCMGSG